jgi:hypothetical protein
MRPILLLVSSLLLAGCGDGGDGAVLEQLRNAGADLSKARDVRYYLRRLGGCGGALGSRLPSP